MKLDGIVYPSAQMKSAWERIKGVFTTTKSPDSKEEYELCLNAYLSSLLTPQQRQSSGHRSAVWIDHVAKVTRRLYDQAFSNNYTPVFKYKLSPDDKRKVNWYSASKNYFYFVLSNPFKTMFCPLDVRLNGSDLLPCSSLNSWRNIKIPRVKAHPN